MQHHDRGATGVARDLPVDCVKLGHLQHPSGVRLGGWVEHLPQGLRRLPQDGSLTMSPSHSVTLKNVLQVQGRVGQSHLQQTGRASYSSWTGKAGHSAQSKTGLVNAAQAQVAAGCSTPCQSQHGRDKKHLSSFHSRSFSGQIYLRPKRRLMSAVFLVYGAPKLSPRKRRLYSCSFNQNSKWNILKFERDTSRGNGFVNFHLDNL